MSTIAVTRLNANASRVTLGKVDVEVNTEPSLTIVEKCLTVQELLQRAIQGMPINVLRYQPNGFEDVFTGDEDLDKVNTTFDEFGDDDLVHLCAAKQISRRIEKELAKRKEKSAAAASGAAESGGVPPAEDVSQSTSKTDE